MLLSDVDCKCCQFVKGIHEGITEQSLGSCASRLRWLHMAARL